MKQKEYRLNSKFCVEDDWKGFLAHLGYFDDEYADLKQFMQGQVLGQKNTFFRWLLSKSTEDVELEVSGKDERLHRLVLKRDDLGPFAVLLLDEERSPEDLSDRQSRFWNSFKAGFSEGILFLGTNFEIEEVSDRTPQIFPLLDSNGVQLNRQAMLGKSLDSFFPAIWVAELRAFFARCELNHLESFNRQFDFEDKFIECKAYPIYEKLKLDGFMILFFDVSERVTLELKLEETKEMISGKSHLIALGELAGKIAHEINTPLASITLSAGLGENRSDSMSPTEVKDLFVKIKDTGFFIGDVVKNLLQFSRQDVGSGFETCHLKEVVDDVVSIAQGSLRNANVTFEMDIDDDCACEMKRVQIQQVFMNLLSNSIEALKSKGGMGARNRKEKWIRVSATSNDKEVRVEFVDSGNGISADVAKKIMTPNYSTKELGENLGIGLSVSLGIMLAHGGKLTLNPDHENTCFIITLPKEQEKSVAA